MPDAPRTLIVDDASLIRLYYRQILEKAGHVVDEALNGLEGLEKLLFSTYDLMIVDINMPKMDGLTFVRTVRAGEMPVAAIPVLMTSTEAGDHDIAAARQAGANFYLCKPVSEEDLLMHAAILAGGIP